MKNKTFCKPSLLGLALGLVACAPVYAAEQPGWFFGISLTRPEFQQEASGIKLVARDDVNRKLSAGYRFSPYWQAELNYLDLTKPGLTPNALLAGASPDTRGRGLQLVGTGTLPVTQKFGLYGKLGAMHSNLESSCATNILTCAGSDRGTDVSYGVGLRYDFTQTVSVKGEWERFRRFGGRDVVGDVDKDFFSVGVGFKF